MQNAEVNDNHSRGANDPKVVASRPAAEMAIAREASQVVAHMLGDGRSVIDPATRIWTRDAAEDLRGRVRDNPILGTEETQWEKFDRQLEGAPRDVVLLAAELVFLREHALVRAKPETRRQHVERVLGHVDPPVVIPDAMEAWLGRPSGSAGLETGRAYNGSLWRHIIWASTFVRYWNGLAEAERESARMDPWELQEVMLASGEDRSDIRNVFQFLARPETFEPISLASLKAQIRDGLADRIDGASGADPVSIDRDLLGIRGALASEVEGPFQFWTPGVQTLWDTSSADAREPRPRHYWIYSPGAQASRWDEFCADGVMAIEWDELGDLASYSSRQAIRQDLLAQGASGSPKNDVLALWQFQNEIAVGDVVYAKRGRREIVGRGEVTSDARFEPERGSFTHVRSVKWTQVGKWEHPGDASVKTLTDVTPYLDYVEKLEALFFPDPPEPLDPSKVEDLPAYDEAKFLSEVYLSAEDYQRVRGLLARKKNVILAGAPGVGKTYAARRLAYSIMGVKDPSRIQMVQFHQSYSYEDFMMGYRPTESGGFALAEGPFYRFCEEARKDDSDRDYFFIIDEINRGNISKIFGELLMLIEADKRGTPLRLLYKNETFSVPANVHIVGMMNTADRSLAVLDYALRRRFGFFNMKPGFDTEGFKSQQEKAASPALNRLVKTVIALNRAIAGDPALGEGFVIGHSFLMPARDGDAGDDAWLRSVIEDELIPLLTEYWFDEPTKVGEWAEKLRAVVE